MGQDFIQDIVHPDNLCGYRKPVPTQGYGLSFKPLAVLFDIGLAHRCQCLLIDQPCGGKPLKVIKSHYM
ncbi:hypothetical protein D3C75_1143080 [compost metagenome]